MKYTIKSIDKQAELEIFHIGEAMIEAQKKSNEWSQLVALKNRKGKVIQNFTPDDYRPV